MTVPPPRHVLAFDTAMSQCAAALYDPDSGVCAARTEDTLHGHAGRLVPLIDALVETCGKSYDCIGLIAVTTGPGSFTGLRVGLSCARGLALALGVPVRGFGTLETLAAQLLVSHAESESILALVETRRDNLFWQSFDRCGRPLGPAQDSAPEDVPLEGCAALCGDGVARFLAHRPEACGLYAPAACRAIDVGYLAERAAREEEANAPPRPAIPLYIRPPDVKPRADTTGL
jgi:tRNA threonylcarbamoyladenosine biosynthesis protein TsaB